MEEIMESFNDSVRKYVTDLIEENNIKINRNRGTISSLVVDYEKVLNELTALKLSKYKGDIILTDTAQTLFNVRISELVSKESELSKSMHDYDMEARKLIGENIDLENELKILNTSKIFNLDDEIPF